MEGEVKKGFSRFFDRINFFNKKKIEQYKDKIDTLRYEKLLEMFSLYYTKDGNDVSENYFIKNIIDFRDKRAQDIMIPRIDIIAAPVESEVEDIIKIMSKSGFSRIPIYEDNLDNTIGFIHVKDLLPSLRKKHQAKLPNMVRGVLFISPYMKLLDLLYEMKLKGVHMAMVVDEFGGVDGLITFEDILEEIIGGIRDEYNKAPAPKIIEIESGILEADGRVNIHDLEEYTGRFSTQEENEESNTISGLIVALVGYVPSKSEIIIHPSGIEFKIISVDPLKINKVMVDYRGLHKNDNTQ
ncbi:MAG: hemolysin family protein [Alphaproteobacteria bacterium]|nr:hemolysin family protein [Alphaproteobacteria bacterium]